MRKRLLVGAVGLAVAGLACGVGIRRDLGSVAARTVVFDDLCGVQDYWDAIGSGHATAPVLVSSTDLESTVGRRAAGGRSTFAFETEFQLGHLRRVLAQNWMRLPPEVATAKKMLLEVRWSEVASVKRVVTVDPAELLIGRESHSLPYQVCLSELLFGEGLYRSRREVLGLPPLSPGPLDAGPPAPIPVDTRTPVGLHIWRPDAGAAADRPAADRSGVDRPTPDRPTADRPAAEVRYTPYP